jgi:hypothetical protein
MSFQACRVSIAICTRLIPDCHDSPRDSQKNPADRAAHDPPRDRNARGLFISAVAVYGFRVAITYEAEAEEETSETVIQKIFDELPVP